MFHRSAAISIALCVAITFASPAMAEDRPAAKNAGGSRVIAIDVLLVPDSTMAEKAIAANALLRENYPKGYTLGPAQVPHITLAHSYVEENDLPMIERTLSKLANKEQPLKWELTATGYTYAVWGDVAITTIGIERTRELDDFQVNVVRAIGSNRVESGTGSAFSTSRELPRIDKEIIDYVANFVRNSSGKNYKPHVTIGVAHEDFVKRLQAKPFDKFTFKPSSLAIYQLGNFGTAQKKLWEWKPSSP